MDCIRAYMNNVECPVCGNSIIDKLQDGTNYCHSCGTRDIEIKNFGLYNTLYYIKEIKRNMYIDSDKPTHLIYLRDEFLETLNNYNECIKVFK